MAWTEPLAAIGVYNTRMRQGTIIIRDATGRRVGGGHGYLTPDGTAVMGEIAIDRDGAPPQRVRAYILACREAARLGAEAGARWAHVEVLPKAARLVRRAFGRGRDVAERQLLTGDFAELRTLLLNRTAPDGEVLVAD